MKLGNKIGIVAVLSVLAGCASKPETITPQPYDASHSFAYNIANQTSLTKNKSPLKDFTPEEIDKAKTSMKKSSGGDASLLFGTISILTGNLTGVIDIAGGTAANIANSDHMASKSRWFVAIPKSDFKSENDAYIYAQNKIREASIRTFSKYGKVSKEWNSKHTATYLQIEKDNKFATVGVGLNESSNKLRGVIEGDFDYHFGGELSPSYLLGFSNGLLTFIGPPVTTIADVDIKGINLDMNNIFEDITKQLPEGFYLYVPSFPHYRAYGKVYTQTDFVVPAIYTQGKKYEFIKPEIKPTTSKTAKAEQGGQGE